MEQDYEHIHDLNHDHRHHHQHGGHDVTRYLNIKMFKTGADTAAELAEESVICYIGEAQAGGFLKMMIFITVLWRIHNDYYATKGRHEGFPHHHHHHYHHLAQAWGFYHEYDDNGS